MRIATLCSGIGGADLGWARAGHELVLQAECDPYRRAVLARRYPSLTHYHAAADVPAVSGVDLVHADLPAADPPAVWADVLGAVQRLRPRWVVIDHSLSEPVGRLVRDLVMVDYDLQILHLFQLFVTSSLPRAAWDTRRRAYLIAGPADALAALSLRCVLAELVVDVGVLHSPAESVEGAEQARALPGRWTCLCNRIPCACNEAARRLAIREATPPPVTRWLSDVLDGSWMAAMNSAAVEPYRRAMA